ncbi:hypothetical protein HU200_048292 [Digitaria exilis]|uniref:Uncharacterized protein n=1 Tax=Digitaria exilis TaxID=1010633 RepID=A0A835E803_9POAL|nr:hypothetical protein HU200_048292 [Digitaria exilis]
MVNLVRAECTDFLLSREAHKKAGG